MVTIDEVAAVTKDLQTGWADKFVGLLSLGCQVAMVVGAVVPYIPQYMQIRRSRSAKGFSLYVCLALLMANTFRILFWFGHRYETPLLVQSILMNLAMFALIQLCVSVQSAKDQIIQQEKEHIFIDFDPSFFWRWTDFQSYVEFIMSVGAVGSLLMFFLVDVDPFVESVGFLALFTEAMLGAPQFARNCKNQSTYGMSLQMVLMWTCGDVFKTSYFYVRNTPVQFIVCGALQVTVDAAILAQVWIYRENTNKSKKSDNRI